MEILAIETHYLYNLVAKWRDTKCLFKIFPFLSEGLHQSGSMT